MSSLPEIITAKLNFVAGIKIARQKGLRDTYLGLIVQLASCQRGLGKSLENSFIELMLPSR